MRALPTIIAFCKLQNISDYCFGLPGKLCITWVNDEDIIMRFSSAYICINSEQCRYASLINIFIDG